MSHIAILGATSITGGHLLQRLTATAGTTVTALARTAPAGGGAAHHSAVEWVHGNATDPEVAARVIAGADAVITMVAARRDAAAGTVRSDATRALLAALADADPAPHLVVVSALGGRASRDQQSRTARWVYGKAVGPERLAEVDRQEELIVASGLPATVVRPPRLDDRPASGYREVAGKASVSLRLHRRDLADCLADLALAPPPVAPRFLTIAST